MKRNRTTIAILMLFFSTMLVTPAYAEDTTITVVIASDGNIIGYINGTAINGSVFYYIDGIEVIGEFADLWTKISDVEDSAHSAYNFANSAYFLAWNTNNTLMLVKADVENNIAKIYLLRDELIAFEDDYLVFKNAANKNITGLQIEDVILKNEINLLNSKLQGTRDTISKIIFILICLPFVPIMYYITKKRFPFKHFSKKAHNIITKTENTQDATRDVDKFLKEKEEK